MSQPRRLLAWTPLLFSAALIGCGDSAPAPSPEPVTAVPAPAVSAPPKKEEAKAPEAKKEEPKKDAPKEEPKKSADAKSPFSDDQMAEIKKLPAADQPAAIAQVLCPVGGDKLGEMGPPIKVTAKGKSFFICCASCEKDVKENPDAVLAKLDKKK